MTSGLPFSVSMLSHLAVFRHVWMPAPTSLAQVESYHFSIYCAACSYIKTSASQSSRIKCVCSSP